MKRSIEDGGYIDTFIAIHGGIHFVHHLDLVHIQLANEKEHVLTISIR